MRHSFVMLFASVSLAACGGSSPPANLVNAAAPVNEAAPALDAEPSPLNGAGAAAPGLEAPSASELQAAMNSISDPQLAAQVAPDGAYDAADCVVHIGQLDPVPSGGQAALPRAAAAWRAQLVRELGETGAAQMIGSTANPLQPTPPALRRAAVAWCVANAPRS